jgi:glucose uptake protein
LDLSTTPLVSLALFIVSSVCLGSWAVMFKLSGKRWRYELFSLDFAFGTVLFSSLVAITLGNIGPDLPLGERLLLSSRTAQTLVLSAGCIFGLANLLLMGAVSILGIAGTFPICIGLALVVNAVLNFRSYDFVWLLAGLVLLVFGVLLDVNACRSRGIAMAVPPKKTLHPPPRIKGIRSLKGSAVACIAGVALGVFYPLAAAGIYDDTGLGPYAGLLFFCAGVLISTLVFSILSFNVALEGTNLNIRSYFAGNLRQHLSGIAAGVIWGAGALTALIVRPAADLQGQQQVLPAILPLASVGVALIWGALIWKEFAAAPRRAQFSLIGTAALLVCGFWLVRLAHLR